jgi:hypothetical protein
MFSAHRTIKAHELLIKMREYFVEEKSRRIFEVKIQISLAIFLLNELSFLSGLGNLGGIKIEKNEFFGLAVKILVFL